MAAAIGEVKEFLIGLQRQTVGPANVSSTVALTVALSHGSLLLKLALSVDRVIPHPVPAACGSTSGSSGLGLWAQVPLLRLQQPLALLLSTAKVRIILVAPLSARSVPGYLFW